MQTNYWDRLLTRRIGRRRALAATGSTAAAAAFLAACGGDDDASPSTGGTGAGATGNGATGGVSPTGGAGTGSTSGAGGGLLVPITDTTDQMTRGGVGVYSHPTPVSLDPHLTGGQVAHCWHSYNQLFRIKEGYMENSTGEIEGELAESYEVSPDQTQITVKLKQGVLFADADPVNARAVDAEDVVFSWNRYASISPRRNELVNAANPDAAVLDVTSPDGQTVVITLNEPIATVLGGFAGNLPGTPYIVPREVESPGIELEGTSLGSGAFHLSEYEPGFRAHYVRNPGFKNIDERDLPYLGELEYIDIPDYPAFVAQFKAGAVLDTFRGVIPEEVLTTKQDVPELELYDAGLVAAGVRTLFGWLEESPFKDERVRQAAVMTWDRDLFTEVAFATADLESQGIPLNKPWDSALPAGAAPAYTGWWLDPKGAELAGPDNFYRHDVAAAKQLLEAAGFPDGVDTTITYGRNEFPSTFQQRREILMGMMETSGLFRLEQDGIDFNTEWNPNFRNNMGEFVGMAMTLDTNELTTAVDLYSHYHRGGSRNFGGDDELDRLTSAMLREFNLDARMALAHELQKYEARVQWLPAATSATQIKLGWPAERNRMVWQGNPNRWHTTVWVDRSLPPYA